MQSQNDGRVKHGMYGTRIYRIWAAMKRRCENENYHEFHLYGGRGVTIHKNWKEFTSFYRWSKLNGYNDNLTIDRIDVNGNYEPSNCRWITPKEQSNNRRSNKVIEYKGETKTLKEWSRVIGIDYKCLYKRHKNGWSISEMFETESGGKRVQTT